MTQEAATTTEISEITLPLTYEMRITMTQREIFRIAASEFNRLVTVDATALDHPGETAQLIAKNTGVDFETASLITLSE